jgi:hypothetical protein
LRGSVVANKFLIANFNSATWTVKQFLNQQLHLAKRYATFMRTVFLILLLFGFYGNLHCQIIGRTTLYDEGAWTMISANVELPYKTTDGEGTFELELSKKENSIFILSSWISIEIKNIPNTKKVNIGEISLPMRKSLSLKDYEILSSRAKELCIPVNCWAELLGYEFRNQLEKPCITLKCDQVKYEICEFQFDVENQKVVIEWEKIKVCGE